MHERPQVIFLRAFRGCCLNIMNTRPILGIGGLLIVCILAAGMSPAAAQETDETGRAVTWFKDTFDGSLQQATAVRLHEPDRFVKLKNKFELKYSNFFTDTLGLTVTTHSLYDAVYDIEEELDIEDEDEYRTSVDLRECYVDLYFEKFDLRLGKQQVVWGKTDGFRVTDVVNPLDLKEFVLGEFIDSRIPLWIGKIEYYFSFDFSLQALIIPDLEFTEPANAGSEYAMSAPISLPMDVRPIIRPTDEPEENFENSEYGLKFTGYHSGWDFTLNYLYTWDDEPIGKKTPDPAAGTLTIAPTYERLHIVGGTFATVLWDTVVRGEVAAKIGKYFDVDDLTVTDMAVEKTLLSYALAAERDVFDISWTVQLLQEAILDYEACINDDEVTTNVTLRGTKDYLNDTLEVSLFTIYGVNEQEFFIRPSVEYDLTDATDLTVGVDLFEGGDDASSFGQFDDRDRVYVELQYSF